MIQQRPPYVHALGAAGAALLLYAVTLAPTTWFWDTSEYIATAHILGIPHPPGNPLFVVVGRVWEMFLGVTGLPVPVRINLLAAATSAAATGFMFLAAWRILAGLFQEDGALPEAWRRHLPLLGAWAGAILGSTAYTVWNQSNVNEKVYTLSVLVIAIVTWLALRWRDRRDEPGSGWYLVLAVYLMILGTTNHLMSLLPAPALLVLVLSEKPAVALDRRLWARSILAVVIGLSFNFFLPLRSAEQPIINEGEPVCESMVGAAVAIYSNGNLGCDALAANLAREQYGKPSIFTDPTSDPRNPEARGAGLLLHQFHNYFQYFDWQWARGLAPDSVPGNARLPITLLFLGLGAGGLVLAWQSGRGHIVYMGVLTGTLTVGLVYYLNFRYGYSLGPDWADPRTMREVRERDYFFIASFHLWGFLAGMGLAGACRWAAGRTPSPRSLGLASLVMAVALVPLFANWAWADRSDDHSARDWAWNLLQSVEPYGILFTNGDNDTFPLWYLQEVEGVRQDVSVVVVQYLYTDWYPRQVNFHSQPERQRLFAQDVDLPHRQDPGAPSRSVTTLSDDELNSIRSGFLQDDAVFELGDIAVRYPAGTWLGRGERIALAMIRDSLGERPIHFATTGGLAADLQLNRWAVRQGVSSKLRTGDLDRDPNVLRASERFGGEWVDLTRSLALVDHVHSHRGLQDREIWPDRATLNIPAQFYFLYFMLAEVAEAAGEPTERVNELIRASERFLVTAQGGSRAPSSTR